MKSVKRAGGTESEGVNKSKGKKALEMRGKKIYTGVKSKVFLKKKKTKKRKVFVNEGLFL